MPEPVNIQVGGNVEGSIVVGDNNLVVNTNHGTIIYKQAGAQVKLRGFIPQPPRAPRGFVNRSAELQKLEAWISTNEIVLLHGPDGIGKSALVKQAANSATGKSMQGGVISLEPFDAAGQTIGPNDVIQELFDALFESDPQLKVDAISARTYLSNTRPLVLLDEVPLPQQLQSTLPNLFPQGAILITADVGGAGDFQRLAVGPLPRQEAIGLLASRAGLEINDENRPTLDNLCNRLSDVSLAIVIVGNVLRECNATPAEALNFLQGANPSVLDTVNKSPSFVQGALDRAFSFTFSRLSPEEKKVLSAAAITPGLSMAPEWLNSALGGVDESIVIEKLKSLELLFANSPRLRIQPGFRTAAQRAASAVISENDIYARLLQYLGEGLSDPAFIADEIGNMLGALAWATRHTRWDDVIRLGRGIDAYLTLHGLWDAWETVLGFLREAALATGSAALEGWVLHQLGTRLLSLGDKRAGGNLLREALRIRQQAGDTTGAAYTSHNLNWVVAPPPPTPPVKPPPKFPWGGLIGGAAFILFAGVVAMLGLAYVFWPSAATPTDTPTATSPITLTPPEILPVETTITPSLTPTLTPSLTPSPTPSITPSITPTPTPLGGSGVIVFESQPDPLATETYLLYIMNVESGKTRQLLSDFIPALQAAWSPDGKMLAFASRYNQNSSSQIYTVNADGSNLQMITSMDGNNFHPTWSPDGKRIAILHQYPESGSDIYIISAFASAEENDKNYFNLTNSDATGNYDYPEWSPDGKRIAYQEFVENNWDIFVMDADGSSKPIQLTKASNSENDWSIQPSWSPDSRQIAFASNRNGNFDIYVMDRKGGSVKQLTKNEAYNVMPDWSPDGRLIAFGSNRDGTLQIYLMTENGQGVKVLTKMPGESSEADWQSVKP